MDDRQAEQGQLSRRAGLRALPTPTDIDLFVTDSAPLLEVVDRLPEPRVAELDALLREVDTLRGSLHRDLGLAATAAAAGEDDLAGWLLLDQDGQVRAFEERALAHLGALRAPTGAPPEANGVEAIPAPVPVLPAPRRSARMLPAAPLVAAAAAIVGFLTGVVPGVGGMPTTTSPRSTNAALDSYAELTQLASDGASASRISAAARKFHADLAPLVAAAGADPAAAERAIALLQSEQAVIAGEPDSPALQAVLAQADALMRRLRATLPGSRVRLVVPSPPMTQQQDRRDSSAAKSSPTPKPSPSASATPKASPSPSSTASPSPQPSTSSAGSPLPHAPGLPG